MTRRILPRKGRKRVRLHGEPNTDTAGREAPGALGRPGRRSWQQSLRSWRRTRGHTARREPRGSAAARGAVGQGQGGEGTEPGSGKEGLNSNTDPTRQQAHTRRHALLHTHMTTRARDRSRPSFHRPPPLWCACTHALTPTHTHTHRHMHTLTPESNQAVPGPQGRSTPSRRAVRAAASPNPALSPPGA